MCKGDGDPGIIKELKSILEDINKISTKFESTITRMDRQTNTQSTAYATVLSLIGRSKNGISTTALMKKTGYKAKKIAYLIYKGKKRGEIKHTKKGVYKKI